jgi:hypothetical protein
VIAPGFEASTLVAPVGLAITVGILIDLEDDPEGADHFHESFEEVNRALRKAGLEEHHEPEAADWVPVSLEMYGYSGLHYLRRVAAHLWADHALPPPGTEDTVDDDPELKKYYATDGGLRTGLLGRFRGEGAREGAPRFDHLIVHSDAEGFYIPQQFGEVIRAGDVVGEYVGSSHSLRDELIVLTEALGLPPGLDPESDDLWDASESQGEGDERWQQYGVESFTCVRLLHAANASIEHGAAIVFA